MGTLSKTIIIHQNGRNCHFFALKQTDIRPDKCYRMTRLIASCILLLLTSCGYTQSLTITHLQCENRSNPIGVDTKKPVFSWQLQSTAQSVRQTAYRIIVSDSDSLIEKNKGNIWDSQKLPSSASIQVGYKGKDLQPAKKYYWKVTVWDNKGKTATSSIASFQMGLLTTKDWSNAQWIGYEQLPDSGILLPLAHGRGKREWGARKNILPMLRKAFTINKTIKQATAFISGLGQFEMSINGEKTGDHFLDPGWTEYTKHALYVSFDITNQLREGDNAIGVMLGNGFYYIPGERYRKLTGAYGNPKMIMKLVIEYTDHTTESIVSDGSWKTAPSPVIFSSIYGGEDYDAGLEQAGWNTPTFNDSKWKNAVVIAGINPPLLQSQMGEPIKVMEKFPIASANQVRPNTWVFDLAQNFSGIPSITVRGNKGDTVRIIPAELVNEDGSVNQRNSGSPSFYNYILKGNEKETWQPRFTYYGFRYLQVQAIGVDSTKLPEILNVEGWHIRNAAPAVGTFTCSNELFNKTYDLINWAIKSNMVSLFTDCPHREKLGWLEQTHLMGSSVQYNYDVAALYKKITKDMIYAQTPEGLIPEIAPEFVHFEDPFRDSPEWGSAAIIVPWHIYKWYGDKRTLTESYDMMKRYIEYLRSKADDHILTQGLGDWYDLGPDRPGFSQLTKKGITATAIYYYDLTLMTEIAKLLNKPADAKQYHQLSMAVKNAFNKRFFDTEKLQYDSASQTANAMALYFGLVEPKYRDSVQVALVRDIRSRDNALTAGDIGYRYVLKALEQAGLNSVIFDMNNRDDVPGYGYQLKKGATALTESWQALPSVSNNHFMLGHLMEWFYAGVAGIRNAEDGIAFNKIDIVPEPVGNLSWAKATFNSPYGVIKSEWTSKWEDLVNIIEIKVDIPANTTATIWLPLDCASLSDDKNNPVIYHGAKRKVTVGSGTHTFKLRNQYCE